MQRSAVVGVLGVIVALVVAVGLTATALGLPGGGSKASPVAQATTAPTPTATATVAATPSPSPTPTAIPTPTPIPTPVTVPAPLTGEPVDPAIARRHPIAVMIDDLRPARPQSGLSQADVVWQAPAEGGIPRYMAIFQTELPKAIGPVRSSRYYYITWAAEWRALYAHAGGSPQAIDVLRRKGAGQYVYNADEFRFSRSFHRVTNRFAPHNLYTESSSLRRIAKQLGAKDQVYKPVWKLRPGCAAGAASRRRHDPGQVPRQHDHLPLRPRDEHLSPVRDR